MISKAPINYKVEISAGIATYLTLSYVFLLNPILLNKAGIDISAAFFATVVSAALSTLLMALLGLPFAVAPAPSITTFFVSYVCIKLGLSWESALGAVILSGLLSIIMTALSIKGKLIASIPPPLRVGVVFAISGFLIANGLVQGKIVSYSNNIIDFDKIGFNILLSKTALILYTGLLVTLIFRSNRMKFSGAPVLGILAATIVATLLDVRSNSKASFSTNMLSSFWQFNFSSLLDSRFIISILVFFIIDFFGGVGKYIGLFSAMEKNNNELDDKRMGNALYIDGVGNILGGILGASSLAVFVSSAVGISAGGRTGITAFTTALLILASLFIIPLVGAIPVEATSGVLIYVGLLLMPSYKDIKTRLLLTHFDVFVSLLAAGISFLTYGIDKAIAFVFIVYTLKLVFISGMKKTDWVLVVTTVLLTMAIIAQSLL